MIKKIFLIGISGGTCSGKTYLSNSLVEHFGENLIDIIKVDSYYHDLSHLEMKKREKNNFDHPNSFDLKLLHSDLSKLINNNKIYVKSSICPHFGGPIAYDKNRKYLYCYWHGLQFSTDGKCLSQKNFKACLNSYVYKIVNNSIYIFKNENS